MCITFERNLILNGVPNPVRDWKKAERQLIYSFEIKTFAQTHTQVAHVQSCQEKNGRLHAAKEALGERQWAKGWRKFPFWWYRIERASHIRSFSCNRLRGEWFEQSQCVRGRLLFAVCIEIVALYVSRRRNHTLGASFSAFAHTPLLNKKGLAKWMGRPPPLCLLAADAALIATINNDYAATLCFLCSIPAGMRYDCEPAALIVRRPPAICNGWFWIFNASELTDAAHSAGGVQLKNMHLPPAQIALFYIIAVDARRLMFCYFYLHGFRTRACLALIKTA